MVGTEIEIIFLQSLCARMSRKWIDQWERIPKRPCVGLRKPELGVYHVISMFKYVRETSLDILTVERRTWSLFYKTMWWVKSQNLVTLILWIYGGEYKKGKSDRARKKEKMMTLEDFKHYL